MCPDATGCAPADAPFVLRIPALADLEPGGSRVVASRVGDIALFRASDGSLFAVRDECPHRKGPLSQGLVCGHTVLCPLHNWCIDLASGRALGVDQGQVRTFRVQSVGDYWELSDA
ncbi:MAG TPA: Rieske 2Fe-2S domain-containing protein [Acidiferrobacteraceae bacterium]|nr:Rieske 2Fe-2S domain-containing protein [Acidiferrobacteraceae bacterium]